jgi:2-C-methyl-D-erythritol 4-phosphate cytidylyltransferase
MRYHLIVPAAGSGRRFAADVPTQYADLGGAPVIERTLAPFLADEDCAGIVVAIAADDPQWSRIGDGLRPRVSTVTGGEQRAHSVLNALRSLSSRLRVDDWVFVHDAARPCFSAGDLAALKRELASHAVGGLLAIPMADTLKRGNGEPVSVDATVDRSGLWRAATPQVFRFGVLLPALESALASQRLPTDEAQAVEWAGHRPRLVAGRADNIKVTTPDDLLLASAILSIRETT